MVSNHWIWKGRIILVQFNFFYNSIEFFPNRFIYFIFTIISYCRPVGRNYYHIQFIDFIKAVVDLELKVIALGGSLHADEEKKLLETGSLQHNLWGINIYFDVELKDRIEFDSMINIRPSQNNRSRTIENPEIQKKIISLVNHLIS